MPESPEAMVLRSMNLPERMDDHLRGLAYSLRCSKSELIRHFVLQGLIGTYAFIGEQLNDGKQKALREQMRALQELPETLPFKMGQ